MLWTREVHIELPISSLAKIPEGRNYWQRSCQDPVLQLFYGYLEGERPTQEHRDTRPYVGQNPRRTFVGERQVVTFCRKCDGCWTDKRRDHRSMIYDEMLSCDFATFVTFTVDWTTIHQEDRLKGELAAGDTYSGTAQERRARKALQDYMKRLRTRHPDTKMRAYTVREFTKKGSPHFHFIIFGWGTPLQTRDYKIARFIFPRGFALPERKPAESDSAWKERIIAKGESQYRRWTREDDVNIRARMIHHHGFVKAKLVDTSSPASRRRATNYLLKYFSKERNSVATRSPGLGLGYYGYRAMRHLTLGWTQSAKRAFTRAARAAGRSPQPPNWGAYNTASEADAAVRNQSAVSRCRRFSSLRLRRLQEAPHTPHTGPPGPDTRTADTTAAFLNSLSLKQPVQ